MAEPIIALKDIKKEYVNGDVVTRALAGVTVEIQEGEFVALMGPSGSGKSTLMHIMGFLDKPTAGTYEFRGKHVAKFDENQLAYMRREEVGFVFQFFNLLPNSRVLDNVLLPLIYARTPRAKRQKMARNALNIVGLNHRLQHLSNQLSGGERQRVAIARAIVNEPSVIFADEPTGNLDTKTGVEVLTELAELHVEGHTIVMVTHEEEAAEFAERIIRLRDGKIESDKNDHNRRRGTYRK